MKKKYAVILSKKYAVLIKYKYLEYIENAKLSDADSWHFIKGIIEYDRSGTLPEFSNPVLVGLFAAVKLDIDQNRENYEEVIKERSASGKKGAEARWGKKDSKNGKCHNSHANNDTHKQSMANMADSDYGNDLGYESDLVSDSDSDSSNTLYIKNNGGSSQSYPQGFQQPPPHIIKNIKKESGAHGFFIDTKIVKLFLNSGIDETWLCAPYSYLEYCALAVNKKYPDKNMDELKPLFISAVKDWEDLRDSYPVWKENALLEKKRETEFEKLPICDCGGNVQKTYNNYAQCNNCYSGFTFNNSRAEWTKDKKEE